MDVDQWRAQWYQFEYWEEMDSRFRPTGLVDSCERDVGWEFDNTYLFALEGGLFAVVVEQGRSDYSCRDADIGIYPTLQAAEKEFHRMRRSYETGRWV